MDGRSEAPVPARDRREWIIWILAALTVAAVAFVFLKRRHFGTDAMTRWRTEPLDAAAIARGLLSDDADTICHALVQWQAQTPTAVPDRFGALADHPDDRVRTLLAYAAQAIDDPRAKAVLARLLEDRTDGVRLNAAMGLAKWNDERGAPVIAQALTRARPDEPDVRRELLKALQFVARPADRALLESMAKNAALDQDEIAAGYCRIALDRIRRTEAAPKDPSNDKE